MLLNKIPTWASTGLSKLSTFQALKYHDFRFLWGSQIGSVMTMQTETYAKAWLIIELTDGDATKAATFIGLAHFTRFAGAIAVLVGGVLTDKLDRRYILVAANLVSTIYFGLIGILTLLGMIEIWHIVAGAVLAGGAQAVDNTARQASVSSIVPREGIMNALSLTSVVHGISNTAGPAIAGLMIFVTGTGGAYVAMSGFLFLSMLLLWFVHPLKINNPEPEGNFFQSLWEGFSYSFRTPSVRVVLLVGFTVVLLGAPHFQLLPVYFKEVLELDAGSLGWLAIPGFLTILGGLIAASLGDYKRKGLLLFVAVLSPGIAAIILSQVNVLWLALMASCVFALGRSQYLPTTQTSAMKATPPHLRGRVASALSISSQAGSAGVLLYGLLASQFGLQGAYLIAGLAVVTLQTTYFIVIPAFRRLS